MIRCTNTVTSTQNVHLCKLRPQMTQMNSSTSSVYTYSNTHTYPCSYSSSSSSWILLCD